MGFAGWGNGRDVDTLAKAIKRHVSKRIASSESEEIEPGEATMLNLDDIVTPMEKMISQRKQSYKSTTRKKEHEVQSKQQQAQACDYMQLQHLPPPASTINTQTDLAKDSAGDQRDSSDTEEVRDHNVSDEVWKELKIAKRRNILRRKECNSLQEQARRAREEALQLKREKEEI